MKEQQDNRKTRFQALDGFRGICAICVVFFHMHIYGAFTENQFFRGSDIFVDYFFVLSGFVFSFAYGYRKDLHLASYAISRTFRIFPLHLVMLSVFVIFEVGKYFASLKGFSFNNEPFAGEYAPVEIIPNALLIHSWTGFSENYSFNYPAWSISIEYYMYFIFALSIFFGVHARLIVWLAIAVFAAVDLNMGLGVLTYPAAKGLSCFFAGCLSYVAFTKIEGYKIPSFVFMTAIELIAVVAVILIVALDIFVKKYISTLTFCVAVIIYAFDAGAVSRLLRSRIFEFAGKVSYSIYLVHAAVLFCVVSIAIVAQKALGFVLAPTINGTRYLDAGLPILNDVLAVLVVVVVLLVSSLTYRLIEVPGQKLGKYLCSKFSYISDRQFA